MDRSPLLHPPAVGADQAAQVPLVVDLDGSLLRTDTLVESLFAVARTHPLTLLKVPAWLAQGRARLKQGLAARAAIDVHTLPFNSELVEHLRAQKRRGRHVILATGTDQKIARAVAEELGLFDVVLASDGDVNLTANRKRERLVAEFGDRGFDYVGNSARDLPVWAAARRGLLVTRSPRLTEAAERVTEVERVFARPQPGLAGYFGAMRTHHWLKNLLVLVPLLAAHRLYDVALLFQGLVGVLSFSLAASGVYLLNDLFDLGADRRHPQKKKRALAAGEIPLVHALVLLPCLWAAAAALGLWLKPPFLAALGVYAGLMLAYSMRLKDIAFVDVLVLSMGYTLRIFAGSLAVGIGVSAWVLGCGAALFFGLALLKRYAEIVTLVLRGGAEVGVRAYRASDSALIAGLGIGAGCIAVALLALQPIVEPSDHARWPVWLMSALLLFWTGRMWLMAHRGHIHGDPVVYALRDRISRIFGVSTVAILLYSA